MRVSVTMAGADLARARLEAIGRKVEPVLRGTMNTGATQTRKTQYLQPLSRIINAALVRERLVIKRANSRRLNARIIPSSSSVEVIRYASWGYDRIDATRGRIWVMGPSGRKVAAGFVNPSASNPQPLSTRSSRARQVGPNTRNPERTSYTYRRALQNAQGPSIAYWFRQLTGSGTIRWVNAFLQQELERRIRREIARAGK
ncbi:hypothetical protein [Metapseudomonas otitidis]|uniref:hypothetical protein n=1 Tax=Metapseudomonas otitidis TaxID=319939 RepID=UPI001F19E33B|nr:hypothetical protein [Pseudomonas otitidis]MCO7558031.1 hypothetical protein [Pseudomonas otitidis]